MGGIDTTLWICCGTGTATAGLYLLLMPAATHRTALRRIGWVVYCVGGVTIAGTVLAPTGSFWSLLLFCGLLAAALLSATNTAVYRRRTPAGDRSGSDTEHRSSGGDVKWFLGASAAVAAIIGWHGNYWTAGTLLVATACLGVAVFRSGRLRVKAAPGPHTGGEEICEPALACLTWGLLIWSLMTALPHGQPASSGVNLQFARVNNSIAGAYGLASLGVLQIASRQAFRSRTLGLGSMLLGTLLLCSAVADRTQSELLCLVALTCSLGSVVLLARVTRRQHSETTFHPLTMRGDA